MASRAQAGAKKATRQLVVDVHSHLYPPSYIDLLKTRSEVPYVRAFPPSNQLFLCNRAPQNSKENGDSSETPKVPPGRHLLPHFYDVSEKISFMDTHQVDISVLSLGNPWLDFLPADTAKETAEATNNAMNDLCSQHPDRLFFFAVLPLTAPEPDILAEIARLKLVGQSRGIVMGTGGLGAGLDDPTMVPIFRALADASLPIFLHPNYGLPDSVWGCHGSNYGQILPLSVGFTTETTIAMTRLFLSGVFETVPTLQIIVSHSGGTLPFLAGRVEACIEHDRKWQAEGKLVSGRQTLWDVMRNNIYLDGVIFDKVGLKTAIEASGVDRIMFGTDHPFFAPLDKVKLWPAMTLNRQAAKDALGEGEHYALVMGGNAVRVLNLST